MAPSSVIEISTGLYSDLTCNLNFTATGERKWLDECFNIQKNN